MTLSSLASRRSRRLLAAPAVLAVAVGALVGCSDSGTTTTESTASASESATTTASATETATDSPSSAASGETVPGTELTGRMLQALMSAGSFRTTSPVPGDPTASSTSETVIKDGKSSVKSTVSGAQAMEIIALNNAEEMYIKAPNMQIPTWTKVEANSENQAISMMAGVLEAMKPMMDPANQIKMYEKVTFTQAGEEDVNGVKTTKYTAEVSMADMFAAMGMSPDSMPSGTADQKVPVELYLDEKDRPIKTVTEVNGQKSESTYSDFGAPMTVEAPQVGS